MAKRFSESNRWDDPWYRALPPHLKNFWDFLCCRPDAAGVWKPDWQDVHFRIGRKIGADEALNAFNSDKVRINVLKNGYWQVIGWVTFQFGETLNEKIGQHKSSLVLIRKYTEFGYFLGKAYPNTYPRRILVEEEKEEEKEMEEEKEESVSARETFLYLDDTKFKSTFVDFLEMRKKIRKPTTDRAEKLILKDLHKHPINDAIKMLENSIVNSWQGVFPLKENQKYDGIPEEWKTKTQYRR